MCKDPKRRESIAAQPTAGGVAPLYKARTPYGLNQILCDSPCQWIHTSFRMILVSTSNAERYVPAGEHCKRVLMVSNLIAKDIVQGIIATASTTEISVSINGAGGKLANITKSNSSPMTHSNLARFSKRKKERKKYPAMEGILWLDLEEALSKLPLLKYLIPTAPDACECANDSDVIASGPCNVRRIVTHSSSTRWKLLDERIPT